MQRSIFVAFFISLFLTAASFAQEIQPSPTPKRERVIVVGQTPNPSATATPTPSKIVVVEDKTPKPQPTPFRTPYPVPSRTPIIVGSSNNPVPPMSIIPSQNFSFRTMNFGQLKSKIAEAKRQMQARPLQTAMTDSFLISEVVRVAFHDWETGKIDYAVLTKDAYLDTKTDKQLISSNGKQITVRTIRGNGVNTPLMIFDDKMKTQLPLLVQYPVEKGGRFIETAYYISTHPGIVNPGSRQCRCDVCSQHD